MSTKDKRRWYKVMYRKGTLILEREVKASSAAEARSKVSPVGQVISVDIGRCSK